MDGIKRDALIPYDTVIKEELVELVGTSADDKKKMEEKRESLTAICLSGGGIRSATFNLGLLEGLATIGLLAKFDYLSTVSGGGYIGSWLSSWAKRAEQGEQSKAPQGPGIAKVADTLRHSFREGEEIKRVRFLRDYSNYLTPWVGMLSADTWTLGAIYLRNLLINWLMLLPLFFALLLLPRIYISLIRCAHDPQLQWYLYVGVILGALGVFCTCGDVPTFAIRWDKGRKFCRLLFLPFLVSSAISLSLYLAAFSQPQGSNHLEALLRFIAVGIMMFLPGWLLCSLFYLQSTLQEADACKRQTAWYRYLLSNLAAAVAGAIGGGICYWLDVNVVPTLSKSATTYCDPLLYAIFAVPALVTAYLLAGVIHILLMNQLTDDDDREWWARSGAFLMMAVALWLVGFAIVICGPWLTDSHNLDRLFRTFGISGIAGLITALLGKSKLTLSPLKGAEQKENPFAKFGLSLAALAFLILLAVTLASAASILINKTDINRILSLTSCPEKKAPEKVSSQPITCRSAVTAPQDQWSSVVNISAVVKQPRDTMVLSARQNQWSSVIQLSAVVRKNVPAQRKIEPPNPHVVSFFNTDWTWRPLSCLFLVSLGFSYLVGRITNPNKFSLHALYRARLVRAYLGAIRSVDGPDERKPHPFTGFDREDNMPMFKLPARPFHIINIAWNVVKGGVVGWQERKAMSFTVSKLHCGSANEGYRPSEGYGITCGVGPISLGTAMAISGAAASPNMGYHSSPLITFVMAFFNVRLGWWLGNPKGNKWRNSGPTIAFWPLLKETFGFTDEKSTFIYLSDGGHFENLGLYEMVRRKCQYIVVGDASCDPDARFEDLGNAIRKVRVDLGAEIHMSLESMIPNKDEKTGLNKSALHFAIGDIKYAKGADGTVKTGKLLYIKPALCEDIPVDIFDYAKQNKDFPHQATADQWFGESQFESYRKLGLHSVQHLMEFVKPHHHFENVAELFKALEKVIKDSTTS